MKQITSFTGEYRFLSNFWPCDIQFIDRIYPSVEHAYQASKTVIESEREIIQCATTPGAAKRMGKKVTLRSDWEVKKLLFMELFVGQKFTDPGLRDKLLATGDAELTEGNRWGDTFWGVCNGVGENHLGKILMRLRETLRLEREWCAGPQGPSQRE